MRSVERMYYLENKKRKNENDMIKNTVYKYLFKLLQLPILYNYKDIT